MHHCTPRVYTSRVVPVSSKEKPRRKKTLEPEGSVEVQWHNVDRRSFTRFKGPKSSQQALGGPHNAQSASLVKFGCREAQFRSFTGVAGHSSLLRRDPVGFGT